MKIIGYIKKRILIYHSATSALCCILAFSLLPLCNGVFASEANTEATKEKRWYDGTLLDGTWIPEAVQIHGFLSQGMTHTSDNNFFGNSDDSVSFDYREIGINGSWRVIPELQLSMQVVYRDAGKTDEQGVRIDYGLADYSYFSSESTLLGVRAGRVPTPLGFYNDTRDVASTRPGILLPQSIYFDINRNLAISADGGYFYGEHRTDYGDFLLHAGVVIPRTNDPDFKNFIVGDAQGEMEGDVSWVTRLHYEWRSGLVRLAFTYADFNANYNPVPGTPNFQPGSFKFNPFIFSAQYNGENWSLTAEYAIRKFQINNFGNFPGTPFNPDTNTTGDSFYVQGTYRFTSFMEGMVRYDQLIWDWNDRDGEKFAKSINGIISGQPAYSRFAKDWTVGMRFTLLPKLLLSAEYHYVEGTGWLSPLENPDPSKTSKYWSLYMMMISYDF